LLPGLALFASGLVKKMVFADPLGSAVNAIYAHPGGHSFPEYLLALYGFSVQIYCDFSGYTDMALGTAQVLGVRLPSNFLQPYLATSMAAFWHRWHRTLSHWLRDYIYFVLGGNRVSRGRLYFNATAIARMHDFLGVPPAFGEICLGHGLPLGEGEDPYAVRWGVAIRRWRVILAALGQAGRGHVRIADGFDLFQPVRFGQRIELGKNAVEQLHQRLRRLARR
jgi:hypothetical protein